MYKVEDVEYSAPFTYFTKDGKWETVFSEQPLNNYEKIYWKYKPDNLTVLKGGGLDIISDDKQRIVARLNEHVQALKTISEMNIVVGEQTKLKI